jgi:hypothetical protein
MKPEQTPPQYLNFLRRWLATALFALLVGSTSAWLPSVSAAPPPPHGIVAANINVQINDFDNTSNSVTLSTSQKIGDFRLVPAASNNGDYDTQIGDNTTNNVTDGIMMSSVAQNGRDDGSFIFPGTNFCTSMIDYHRPGSALDGAYWIALALCYPNSLASTVYEYDINVAGAWFPYTNWIGGFARNATAANGGALDLFTGSPGLVLGANFVDLGGGKSIVDLRSLGIDSRTDGVLLVEGAKNEDNFALSQVNTNDGTWNIFLHDNGANGSSTEQDPVAFVFIPRTNTTVISGRFLGGGTIDMYSGNSPQFTISSIGTGQWELKIPGHSPRFGVLIISPEGGFPNNQDNMVTYNVNDAGDGWIIQSRDLPAPTNAFNFIPPLQTPATEPVASFVYIPGATPGFTVTPTNGLFTSENGDTATFTVALDVPPTNDVTIGVSSSDTTEGIASPSSLTFTSDNWDVPQTVTVTGQDDTIVDGTVAYNVILSAATSGDSAYNGLVPPDVSLKNADNDSGGITVNPTHGLITTEAGGTATFTVVLNTAPTADVTIGLSSSDTTEGTVSPDSLTFTSGDWSTPQTVTVTGVDDSVADGNIGYTIITAPASSTDQEYDGQNPADVSVTNMDDDTAGLVINPVTLNVVEGEDTNFTVALSSQPLADVVVNVASGDLAQGGTVTPTSLTFTAANWNTPQIVTLAGVDDLVADGNTSFNITNTASSDDSLYAALPSVVIPATTLDNEAALALPSGGASYGVGTPAIGIDGQATVADPYTPDYDGVTLTVTLSANGTANDRLEIRNTGTDTNQIGVSGNNVSYSGTVIGTFTGGSGTTPLVITFDNAATPDAAQALLRSVTFRNINSSNPSLARRSVTVSLAHLDGGTSTATTTVAVGLVSVTDFQDGTDRGYGVYTNEADIELFQSQPDNQLPYGHQADTNNPELWVDAPDSGSDNNSQVLLRFDNIVGNNPGQIPTNATIVYAELILNVTDSGDGSPLHRMLIPWDAEGTTWDSIGGGVQTNDVVARSEFDSQIGVSEAAGSTGLGHIEVGVTADVQAWVNGEANYGWVMPSWIPAGTDGMGFSPSETTNIVNRPRLRVLWVPAGTAVASFRQGVNGYTSAQDTRIRERAQDADTDFSTVDSFFVDWAVTGSTPENDEQILMRFDNIIGTNADQIPPGAHIDAAMLDLATVINNGYGDGGQFFAMLEPWQDTNTWNQLGGIQADGVKAASTPTATAGSPALDPNVCGGYMSFDVTSDVQAWSLGSRTNYGWAILPWPNGADGWGISSAAAAAERDRPQLRVFYDTNVVVTATIVLQPPIVETGDVQIHFTGTVNDTYTIWRAATVNGPWSNIGTAVVGSDGTGVFMDNTPLSGAAFYRVSFP